MYTDMKTILANAAANHYAVIATSPINLEMARGMVLGTEQLSCECSFIDHKDVMVIGAPPSGPWNTLSFHVLFLKHAFPECLSSC